MAFGVKMTVKNLFFDRAKIVREVGKMNAAALSKAGAFVRRRARSLLRRRKKTSAPGSPPSVHSSDDVASLKNILFAYDRSKMSVVIGPVLLNGSQGQVPALHEFGGVKSVRQMRGSRNNRRVILRPAKYPARPFMGPALVAEAPNFPSLWVAKAGGAAA